jgi:BolA protein
MSIQNDIEQKLQVLHPEYLEVLNESHMHNVPKGSESHFKVTLVSPDFVGKKLVARHRMINQALAEELGGAVHALSLHTLTPEEWAQKAGQIPQSPPCMGGSGKNG